MALSKIQAESMNLADTYAFTGTVSGAGEANDYVHISTSSGTSISMVDFSNFGSYGLHVIHIKDLYLSSDSDLRFRFRISSGGVSSSNYHSAQQMRSAGGNSTTGNVTGTDSGQIFNAIDDNGGGEDIRSSLTIYIPQVASGNNPSLYGHGYQQSHNGNRNTVNFGGIHSSNTAVLTGLQLYPSSGNFSQISASLYGVKNA